MTTCGKRCTVVRVGSLDSLVADHLSVNLNVVGGGTLGNVLDQLSTGDNRSHSILNHVLSEGEGEGVVGDDVGVNGIVGGSTLRGTSGVGGTSGDRGLSGSLLVCVEESHKVLTGLNRAVLGNVDDTVVVGLLGVLINETTREDVGHVLVVEGSNLLPETWGRLVTSELGEEDGEGVVGVVLNELVVSGSEESVVSTPLVGVDSEKVNVSNGSTLEVLGEGDTEVQVIGVGVSDGNDTGDLLSDVRLHVTDNSLEVVGGGLG
jgi:hypothetical protein